MTQGVEGMSTARKGTSVRITALLVVAMLVLGAFALTACGGTQESPGGPTGTGAPETVKEAAANVKTEVIAALKAAGANFNETYLSVTDGPAAGQVTISGPVTLKGGTKTVTITFAKGKDGKWAIVSTK
jgi:hypothetical protein